MFGRAASPSRRAKSDARRTPIEITLIGKPGCHLCDDAREVIATVRVRLEREGVETYLTELNILEDEQLARKYAEDIPVVRVSDRQIAIWRVDARRLEDAIRRAAS